MGSGTAIVALLVACGKTDLGEPYYSGEAPVITGIAGAEDLGGGAVGEAGNLGGRVVTIQGSGFGSDPNDLVVYFGTLNADILSVTDTSLEVRTPRGPLEGGAVDVQVATSGGVGIARGAYTYDVGDLYEDEVGYILVTNDWASCYGGRDDPYGAGCDTFSYVGQVGLEGRSEVFDFAFPRVHSQYIGFYGGTDSSPTWRVETPAQVTFAYSVNDLRRTVGDFQLVNPALEGETWCADLTTLGSWSYGGDGAHDPTGVGYAYSFGDTLLQEGSESCDGPNERRYDLSVMPFCEVPQYQENHSNDYQAEWVAGRNFFVAPDENGDLRDDLPVTVTLEAPEAGLDGVDLVLPEPVRFQMLEGVDTAAVPEDLWPLGDWQTCFDDDGDGNTTLDETAVRFTWTPTSVDLAQGSRIEGSRVYVRFTMTVLSLGWFGGEAYPVRATIEVPDDHGYDPETGLSSVDVPVEVFYQFPTTNADLGSCSNSSFGTVCTYTDPLETGYGYLVVTADRVTEYRLRSDVLGGDVVFAYVTGDFGFYGWDNPLDNGSCGDCLDQDGDGWTDADDPDCMDGIGSLEEDGATYGLFSCNDGLDNDQDGLIDAEDSDCENGADGETNCSDGIDNDGDGWVDDLDGECAEGGADAQELGQDLDTWGCSDGVDEDGDGWIDGQDPDCVTYADQEVGFAGTACNDGVDNDGHGDADALDPYCYYGGALVDSEEPDVYTGDCDNGLDDDGDGYVDRNDPDCELNGSWRELDPNWDPALSVTPDCYNGLDDDGDGLADAADPACWNEGAGYEPDGFLRREASAPPQLSCSNGLDDDGDGWTDLDDPACTVGVGNTENDGLGTTACNNGLDDDGDGLADAADPDCTDGRDTAE